MMEREMPGEWPKWELVGPDENGLVEIEWQGETSPTVHGFPLGQVEDVAPKLADFLGRVDFGETVEDRGET
jgi:hypothetical protein